MKSYTIVDHFDGRKLWVANYATRSDAVKAFECYLNRLHLIEDGKVFGMGDYTPPQLFEELMETGYTYGYFLGDTDGQMFVRAEELHDAFNEAQMPF